MCEKRMCVNACDESASKMLEGKKEGEMETEERGGEMEPVGERERWRLKKEGEMEPEERGGDGA